MNDNTSIKAPGNVTTEEYFGGCPRCGMTDGFVNLGSDSLLDHWFVCGEHRVRWYAGTNLFSPCDIEDANQKAIAARWLVASFAEVKAIYPDDDKPADWAERIAALPWPNLDEHRWDEGLPF